ncbi:lipid storage droplets surface-binding protein 2 isoform X3 [Episyrphus balteatus]|uniref:lipid storage droplets surface-binding protein 2 isoform X3 n=1 Tax=Episyrphus balteatus TaxID=286459 RepID=UPI002485E673|nr:lipid storage droplets surface-binding protein 2 isoform X3 [Episyrphus balteatus]
MASSSNNLNNSVVSSNDNAQEKDTQSLLPHLESLERMMNLPVVGAAWQQSQDVYGKVKGNNRLFNWALSTAEDCVTRAVTITSPIVSKFDRPIQYVDQTLVKGIDKLEVKAPIIKDTPTEIYNQAKTKVIDAVHPHIEKVVKLKSAGQQKASSLKDLAWQKANEVLATQYGSLAVNGVDSTTALAERLLEYYFPNKGNDVEEENVPISANEDPVLHTVQTVGRLSNKISRRVYSTVSTQIKHLKKENVNDYLASLIAALRLTQYINFINSSMANHIESSPQSAAPVAVEN